MGQGRVDKKALQNMDNVMTNEFNQILSGIESQQVNSLQGVETVQDLLNFDEKPALMNRAWDPSMAVKVKKGKKSPQKESEDAKQHDLLGLYDEQNQALFSNQNNNQEFNFNAPSQPFGLPENASKKTNPFTDSQPADQQFQQDVFDFNQVFNNNNGAPNAQNPGPGGQGKKKLNPFADIEGQNNNVNGNQNDFDKLFK